jgi:hypothetical protein
VGLNPITIRARLKLQKLSHRNPNKPLRLRKSNLSRIRTVNEVIYITFLLHGSAEDAE